MADRTAESRFTDLYQQHYAAIRSYAAATVPAHEVDDVVADTFVVAWHRLADVPDDWTRGWLIGIARNVARVRARRERRAQRVVEMFSQLPATPLLPDEVDAAVTTVDLQAAFHILSPSDQELLVMAGPYELSAPEIALALGIAEAAVSDRLSRARRRLREAIDGARSPDRSRSHRKAIGIEDDLLALTPVERTQDLDDSGHQLLAAAVESLLNAAQAVAEDAVPESDRAAEIESLWRALRAEWINPRQDLVTIERYVGRLAAVLPTHVDLHEQIERMYSRTGTAGPTTQPVSAIELAITEPGVGDVSSDSDREQADETLTWLQDGLQYLLDSVGQLHERTDDVGEAVRQIQAEQGRSHLDWKTLGLGAATAEVAARVAWILGELGIWGVVVKAVVWTLIALYNLG